VAAHTCASLGADALRPLRPAGAIHPLRSFADPARAAELFPGTACAIDGDREAVALLGRFARALGGDPLRVRAGTKPLYHAGAVYASNYLIAILEAALRLFEKAGLPRRRAARVLERLAAGTLANATAAGLPAALTGPIERGDADTVRRHVEALASQAPELRESYAALGRITVDVAVAKRALDGGEARRMLRALGGGGREKETSRR